MIKVVTSEEMQELDQSATRYYGIPSLLLMENAALGMVNIIIDKFNPICNKNIYIFCGKGNNGGDGLVIARHLFNRGGNVYTFLTDKKRDLKGDPQINSNILQRMVNEKEQDRKFTYNQISNMKELSQYPEPDIIIDALFGTGIKGNIEGISKSIIEYINTSNKKVISVDIPSGLNGSSGESVNIAIKSDMTVTMALPKCGLLINKGPELSGELYVSDIGIPQSLINRHKSRRYLLEENDIKKLIPVRNYDAHKYSCGKVFILAGSVGLTGAAAMCSESVIRSGAGAAILGLPESLNTIMEEKVTEVMTVPLPETSEKTLHSKGLKTILEYLAWADVVLLGPGLSQNKETKKLLLNLLPEIKKPLVLDADALNNLKDNPELIKSFKNEMIITPHYGELSRIIKTPTNEIAKNRIDIAKKVAKEYNLTIILKGAPSIIADKEENIYINTSGNPGMATAGAGDVLAGLVAGFFAQTQKASSAAILGMYIHGLAGDYAHEEFGEHSLIATDIQKNVPKAIKYLLSKK